MNTQRVSRLLVDLFTQVSKKNIIKPRNHFLLTPWQHVSLLCLVSICDRGKKRDQWPLQKPKFSDQYNLHVHWNNGHLGTFDCCDRHDRRDRSRYDRCSSRPRRFHMISATAQHVFRRSHRSYGNQASKTFQHVWCKTISTPVKCWRLHKNWSYGLGSLIKEVWQFKFKLQYSLKCPGNFTSFWVNTKTIT